MRSALKSLSLTANEVLAHEVRFHKMQGKCLKKDSATNTAIYPDTRLESNIAGSIYSTKEDGIQIISANINIIVIE